MFHPNKSESNSEEKDFYERESNEENPFGADMQQKSFSRNPNDALGSDKKHNSSA